MSAKQSSDWYCASMVVGHVCELFSRMTDLNMYYIINLYKSLSTSDDTVCSRQFDGTVRFPGSVPQNDFSAKIDLGQC